MHVAICYHSGFHFEARVLFYGSRFLRVVISGQTRPLDFWYRNGVWSSDCGDSVQVDLPFVSGMGEVLPGS
jgi:hypothetical protein